jgi:hypothetical protein
LSTSLFCRVTAELTTLAPQPGCLHLGARNPHREAIKHPLDPPLLPAPRRAATGGRDLHHEPTSARLARHRAICAGPARCEHRREKRGQGRALLVTFGATAKSDWPRAATERAGGKHFCSFHQTLRQAQGERWDAIFLLCHRPHPNPLPRRGRREQTARFVHTIGLVSAWVR